MKLVSNDVFFEANPVNDTQKPSYFALAADSLVKEKKLDFYSLIASNHLFYLSAYLNQTSECGTF